MVKGSHNEPMTSFILFVGIVAVCVLGAAFGADSRHDGTGHARRNI
jgi:hypothetical protein